MSVKVSSWVWHDAPVDDRSELLVLLALADHARDDGSGAYPSITTLAAKARLSRRAVFDVITRLKVAGLIVAEGTGPRGTVAYRVCMGVQRLHHEEPNGVQPPHRAAAAPVQIQGVGGADPSTKGVQQAAPEPSFKPSERTSLSSHASAGARDGAPRGGGGQGLGLSLSDDHLGTWAGRIAEYLQRTIDGLATDERCKPASAVEVLRDLQATTPSWDQAWAVAVDTRCTVQAQNRAPNIVALYRQKLRSALAGEEAA